MHIVHTLSRPAHRPGRLQQAAFVPTMGTCTTGTLPWRQAKPLGDATVVSIFVKLAAVLAHDPDSYPRTWEADCDATRPPELRCCLPPRARPSTPEPQTFRLQPDPLLADMLEGHFARFLYAAV